MSHYQDYQDYQDPSVRHNCHGWPSAGEKSLKLINTPSHSPNDGQASPCLNSIPLKFLSSSLVPSYALYFLITVLYMHHNPLISDLSFNSYKPGYMLFLELFDTVLMKSTKIHSSLQTLTHNLTPPSLHVSLPHKNPIIPIYPNSIPIYPTLYTFLWKPINQSSGGVVDDMAIYSPHNSPLTDLNTI